MSKVIDITGQRFGNITILRRVKNDKDGRAQFEYLCDCGNKKIGRGKDIREGKIVSCGCKYGNSNRTDIINQTFNELTALQYEYSKNGKQYWRFRCSCGTETIKNKQDVIQGKIKSCGCKTNLLRSNAHRIYEPIGTIYGYLQILEPAYDLDNSLGDTAYKCRCLNCGREVIIKSINLRTQHSQSCGCIKSYKELEINQILQKHNISFITEYSFDDLKSSYNKKLRFDFALFKNNSLIGLIEYQGSQHYNELSLFGIRQRQETDNLKVEYCKINKIPLLILNKDNVLENDIINFYNEVI